jgi:hypothetical protein
MPPIQLQGVGGGWAAFRAGVDAPTLLGLVDQEPYQGGIGGEERENWVARR